MALRIIADTFLFALPRFQLIVTGRVFRVCRREPSFKPRTVESHESKNKEVSRSQAVRLWQLVPLSSEDRTAPLDLIPVSYRSI